MHVIRKRPDLKNLSTTLLLGFSLIELMVVIAIIGILGVVAIPAYQDYITRAKFTRLMILAQPAKMAVSEAFITGLDPQFEAIQNQDLIKELKIEKNAIILTADSEKMGLKSDKSLKITLSIDPESNQNNWLCQIEPAKFKKFAPPECTTKK